MHSDEARTEALDAGVVLVACVLVNLALAAQLGFLRQHRQAVGLLAAVTATLAHGGIDEHALGRVFQLAALAPTTLLGGTGLVVDDHRDALEFTQLTLHRIQFAAMVEAGDRREGIAGRVLVRLVADQRDTLDALVGDLPAELVDAQLAVDGLAAGHGHGIVVENLEGDVDACCHCRTHREAAGVEVGAVAEVLEHVRGVGERRLADPVDALAAHLSKGLGAPVHPLHHVVTADTGRGAAALGHLGGGVVRAAGAVVRRAHGAVAARGQGLLLGGQEGQACLDAVAGVDRREALGDHPGDHRRGQLGEVRQQRVALLVELADHPRTLADGPVVELSGELVLDDAALLLDHQYLVQPLGELVHRDRFQRPAHANLEHAQADRGAQRFVQAQVVQRLTHVEIGLAGGDDAKPRIRRIEHHPVQVVGPGEGACGVDLVQVEALFLSQRRVRPADVHAVLGQLEIFRDTRLHAQRIDFHHGGGVDVLGDGLQGHPAAGVARQLPADDAVVENFLNVGRVQHRNRGGNEGMLALVRQRRGFAAVVVTRQQQHTALGRHTCRIRMLEHVAGTVDARPLAVPHGEHAVVPGAGEQVGLLAAPHRGGGQLFVDARLEVDGVLLEVVAGFPEALVQPAQWRAAIAGDEATGVQTTGLITLMLQHRQAGQRLGAGEVQMTGSKPVLVVQTDLGQRHGALLICCYRSQGGVVRYPPDAVMEKPHGCLSTPAIGRGSPHRRVSINSLAVTRRDFLSTFAVEQRFCA